MQQSVMDRQAGQGCIVLLADRSSSMPCEALEDTDRALPGFLSVFPGLRVYAFHAGIVEVRNTERFDCLRYAMPHRGLHKSGKNYVNSTFLGASLEAIAQLRPQKTIVISDGGVADAKRALAAADRMSGDIDAYFCRSTWEDKGFMRELARRGRGRFAEFDPGKTDMGRLLQQSFSNRHGGNPMKRYPDHYIRGNQIDVRRTPDQHIDMPEHIHVHHRPIINHHRHAPVQIEHGEAGRQTVYIQGTQINVHQAPAEQHQQVTDRGHVVEVRHKHAALPKLGIRMPGARQLALPAPSRVQNGRPLGLPAPEQPMQRVAAREGMLAAFTRGKR